MAKEPKTAETQEPKTAPAVEPESVYSAAEIAAAAKGLFGYSQDIATAALRCGGVSECTLSEARRIIKVFAERKV